MRRSITTAPQHHRNSIGYSSNQQIVPRWLLAGQEGMLQAHHVKGTKPGIRQLGTPRHRQGLGTPRSPRVLIPFNKKSLRRGIGHDSQWRVESAPIQRRRSRGFT